MPPSPVNPPPPTLGRGAVFTWDIAELPPQAESRHSMTTICPDYDTDDDEPMFKGHLNWRDVGRMTVDDLEVSVGVAPQQTFLLQRFSEGKDWEGIKQTCLLSSGDAGLVDRYSTVPQGTLLATMKNNMIVAYDLETQRAKQQLFGHLFEVEDISPAPAAWSGAAHVFVTCARLGDVKLWDLRCTGGAAAVTLTNGCSTSVFAVVLAANSSASGTGSSAAAAAESGPSRSSSNSIGGGNQLGASMLCFAGGEGESVWAWDLRRVGSGGSRAQALYELSTGNMIVNALAWHEGSSSLMASCESDDGNR